MPEVTLVFQHLPASNQITCYPSKNCTPGLSSHRIAGLPHITSRSVQFTIPSSISPKSSSHFPLQQQTNITPPSRCSRKSKPILTILNIFANRKKHLPRLKIQSQILRPTRHPHTARNNIPFTSTAYR